MKCHWFPPNADLCELYRVRGHIAEILYILIEDLDDELNRIHRARRLNECPPQPASTSRTNDLVD